VLAQLFWGSYIIQKATIFNPTDFSSFIFKFPKFTYENGKKSLNFAQQASHNTWMWSKQPVDQREHKRINQID
tara:strand:+ start:51 stop:269 length:219 start_codon:yes stop_codon:yes gene_type:complete